jgi:hypothetical protein
MKRIFFGHDLKKMRKYKEQTLNGSFFFAPIMVGIESLLVLTNSLARSQGIAFART